MNEFDRDNFEWFSTASAKELEQWYEQADINDLKYMIRLVQEELTNLSLEEMDIRESTLHNYVDPTKKLLSKFTLKGKINGS